MTEGIAITNGAMTLGVGILPKSPKKSMYLYLESGVAVVALARFNTDYHAELAINFIRRLGGSTIDIGPVEEKA